MSLTQLSRLLPLPDNELQQILDYASTLPKPAAAEHLSNLLGTEPQAVSFISSFNAKRRDAPGSATPSSGGAATPAGGSGRATPASGSDGGVDAAPRGRRGGKKEKAPLHVPQARKIEGPGFLGTAYNKREADLEYIPKSKKTSPAPSPGPEAGQSQPRPQSKPQPQAPAKVEPPKEAPAQKSTKGQQSGFLISDPAPKAKPKSSASSRSATPKPATKVSISGGTPMKGASTALTDLDAAIRTLELSTNPRATGDPSARRCNCVATRHPLQSAAPNCQACGKVICVREGLGPCTFCGARILSSSETEAILGELKAERSREKQAVHRAQHKKADVSRTPAAFTKARDGFEGGSITEAEARAREHRDRLLSYQAENAQRTTVRDEVADFDVGAAMGGQLSMWATAEERALELKRQQRVLREMEWEARPEWEKRREVLSIDIVGGKIVRKMAAVERPTSPEGDVHDETELGGGAEVGYDGEKGEGRKREGGTFSKNPLLGSLIRPVYAAKEDKGKEKEKPRGPKWRRVQDDLDDNEDVILDGGVYGHHGVEEGGGADEPARG